MMLIQLQILKRKQDGQYVAPRVLQQILNYIETAVGHAHTWKILKNVYNDMLVVILFPLLCFTDDDQDLWDDDPQEFIRSKFDVFEDFISPNTAAQTVIINGIFGTLKGWFKSRVYISKIIPTCPV